MLVIALDVALSRCVYMDPTPLYISYPAGTDKWRLLNSWLRKEMRPLMLRELIIQICTNCVRINIWEAQSCCLVSLFVCLFHV